MGEKRDQVNARNSKYSQGKINKYIDKNSFRVYDNGIPM